MPHDKYLTEPTVATATANINLRLEIATILLVVVVVLLLAYVVYYRRRHREKKREGGVPPPLPNPFSPLIPPNQYLYPSNK
ncbi:Hypothetical protein SRAE_0000066600 [Strongyloides ratti]|uniref:Uncharacterized protein n=1 Tax=Strongyloides ratti TaxID=34506 RepID=A0A090KVK8_STRRB|nr:Hypothetical protein SRAE_0000066600 [Strongyloides ratti]CEF61545.1 Hypothetical protein SRAE_0000066600 [Strongyloides ratti]